MKAIDSIAGWSTKVKNDHENFYVNEQLLTIADFITFNSRQYYVILDPDGDLL